MIVAASLWLWAVVSIALEIVIDSPGASAPYSLD